jgi:formylglycine-generating enzyme required for sulfatase activity
VVSNVRASQRTDGSRLVDLYYDLAHTAGCTVWPVFSADGGASWNVPAMTFTGDLGPGVAPGTFKHIVWDAAGDIPGVVGTYRARVYADDAVTTSNMVLVPAGTFPYQRNFSQQVFVDTFLIDKYEVTNQRYAEFLNAADLDGQHWDSGMEITRSSTPPNVFYAVYPGRQNYPIRYVSAIDAEAFAAWLSTRDGSTYRLPTEQEWEKAAAWDPTIGRHWAFAFQSDTPTCGDGNFYHDNFCPYGAPTEVGHYNGTNGTIDAHSFYGCYDMSGNFWELTGGQMHECPYVDCPPIRGGSYRNSPSECVTTRRAGLNYRGYRTVDAGFRLVQTPN